MYDPRNQDECKGDDAMLASHYDILNLKRKVPIIMEWMHVPDDTCSGPQNRCSLRSLAQSDAGPWLSPNLRLRGVR